LEKKLTARQSRFVDNYVDCGNGAEAARKAGYSENSAKEIAAQNLTKLNIQAFIAERMDEAGITEKRLLQVLDEGLSATKTHFSQKGDGAEAEKAVYDDYAVRHRYLDTALKLRDMFPAEKKKLQHEVITPEDEQAARERVNRLLERKVEEEIRKRVANQNRHPDLSPLLTMIHSPD